MYIGIRFTGVKASSKVGTLFVNTAVSFEAVSNQRGIYPI